MKKFPLCGHDCCFHYNAQYQCSSQRLVAIMDLIENWAALENDLEAASLSARQSKLGASDKRIKLRISVQIMRYDALVESWGGTQMIVRIEDPD